MIVLLEAGSAYEVWAALGIWPIDHKHKNFLMCIGLRIVYLGMCVRQNVPSISTQIATKVQDDRLF